jgi:hypothetical protein
MFPVVCEGYGHVRLGGGGYINPHRARGFFSSNPLSKYTQLRLFKKHQQRSDVLSVLFCQNANTFADVPFSGSFKNRIWHVDEQFFCPKYLPLAGFSVCPPLSETRQTTDDVLFVCSRIKIR